MNMYMRNDLTKFEWDIEVLSEKYPLFKANYDYLLQKHNKFELSGSEMMLELQMSNSDFYVKKEEGHWYTLLPSER